MVKAWWALGLLALATGCAGTHAQDTGPVVDGQPQQHEGQQQSSELGTAPSDQRRLAGLLEDLNPEDFITVHAFGDTPVNALQQAQIALQEKLLGPEDSRPLPPWPTLFDPGIDVLRQSGEEEDQTALAVLGLLRDDVEKRLKEWATQEGQTSVADANSPRQMLRAGLEFWRYQEVHAYACDRILSLALADCPPGNTTLAQAQLEKTLQRIVLEPHYPAGIPFHPERGVLAPVSFSVRWKDSVGQQTPWPDLPLHLRWNSESEPQQKKQPLALKTDEAGNVSLPVTEPLSLQTQFNVEIDLAGLVPQRQLNFKAPSLSLKLRNTSAQPRRLALLLSEGVGGESLANPAASEAIVGQIQSTEHHILALNPSDAPALVDDTGSPSAEKLKQYAIKYRGEFDLLLFGTAKSEFAGRMGARSVWHEATLELRLFDVWTGRVLQSLTQTARAYGVGDHSAGIRSLSAAGKDGAKDLVEFLREEP